MMLFDKTSKAYIVKWNNNMFQIEQMFNSPEGIGDIMKFGF